VTGSTERQPADETVHGERAEALVNAARTVQSRVSGFLAAGLMIALGLSALTWYYARALTRPSHARAIAQAATASRAQGEMLLPSLGRIVPPHSLPAAVATPEMTPTSAPEVPLAEARIPAVPLGVATGVATSAGVTTGVSPSAPKTPGELVRERRLSGDVFVRQPESSILPPTARPAGTALRSVETDLQPDPVDSRGDSRRGEAALAALLRPTSTAAVQAQLLPTARFLLPKGAFIDCTLETAIDSTLPGMTSCITAADTFGADGKVVLLERGSKLVGETRGQVQQGQARVFVVWTQARTPTGVVVPLDSPGTDELGRSGLPGEVHRHFWERFGAAMLISVLEGAIQAGVQAANQSGGAVLYAPSLSQDVLTEALKDTARIPPTIVKGNGDRIQVLVARDLDFRSVYELRTPGTAR
jgi:type IV secretion system protein VirB10